MKKQITRISILQSSKIATVLYVVIGFLYTLIGIPMIMFGGPQLRIVGFIYLFGPAWLGVIGFVLFVITAAIYNLLASLMGGIEFEVRDVG